MSLADDFARVRTAVKSMDDEYFAKKIDLAEYNVRVIRQMNFLEAHDAEIEHALRTEERLQKLLTEWRGRKKTIETVDVVQFLEHILHGKEAHGVLSRMPGT